jgi:hypothetical protein
MSVVTVAATGTNEPMTDELGTGHGLASAFTAYATLAVMEIEFYPNFEQLIQNENRKNGKERFLQNEF